MTTTLTILCIFLTISTFIFWRQAKDAMQDLYRERDQFETTLDKKDADIEFWKRQYKHWKASSEFWRRLANAFNSKRGQAVRIYSNSGMLWRVALDEHGTFLYVAATNEEDAVARAFEAEAYLTASEGKTPS